MESKTFGKVKDEAFAGMMIAVITDPIGNAYLVTPDLLEILTQAGLQDVSLRSRPMNRASVLLLWDSIDKGGSQAAHLALRVFPLDQFEFSGLDRQ